MAVANNSQAKTGKVLVLGFDPRSTLATVRSLGRRGLQVHLAWCPADSMIARSRYVRTRHELPPYHQGLAWLEPMKDLLRRERFDLVIPCHDETTLPLLARRAELEPLARLAMPAEQAYCTTADKIKTCRLADELGVCQPRWRVVATYEEALAAATEFGWPVVLKPQTSCTPTDLTQRNAVHKAADPDALRRNMARLLPRGEVLLQEHCFGSGVGVELLADRGEVLAQFQHVRVHEPLKGGGGTYRKSVAVDPELGEAARKLMRALQYTGVAMVEFKYDFQTRRWALMEINGRLWGSLPLTVAAGADFPWYLYQFFVQGRRDFPRAYRTEYFARNLKLDSVWTVQNLRADRTDPTLHTVPPLRVAVEYLHILQGRESWDEVALDDMAPALYGIGTTALKIARLLAAKARLAWMQLPPVRQVRARQAQAALSRARSVLFVCLGNICRSPFAHYYALTRFPENIRVASSGYFPEAGRLSPRDAIETAREFGVDLEPHRSGVLDDAMMRDADVIFVFDGRNLKKLRERWPQYQDKIHLLGLMNPHGPVVLRDPFEHGRDCFREEYQKIAAAIDKSAPLLPRQ